MKEDSLKSGLPEIVLTPSIRIQKTGSVDIAYTKILCPLLICYV
jgi:hypothetical protein